MSDAEILPLAPMTRGTQSISSGGMPLAALSSLIRSPLPLVSSETTRMSTESISGGP